VLDALAMAADVVGAPRAAELGLAWIGGRILYFVGYRKAVEKRLPGFFIQSTVGFLLFIGAIVGIVMHRSGG
jgi:glutathione S-transferase